jgi:cytochrome c oxidase cbb3-type subunit III
VHRIGALFLGTVLFPFGVTGSVTPPQDTHEALDREMARPMIRGGIVYKNYCVVCHGERGDGVARASKLYAGVNLTIKSRSAAYSEKIIRKGGGAIGGSSSMPPWKDELSHEQIEDVVAFLMVLGDPVRRGEVVFKTNCVLCHGVRGDGKGRAAALYDPPPADLTETDKSDEYKEQIIRQGGSALGRSSAMPIWERRLTKSEIADLIPYLRSISVKAAPRSPRR